VQLNSPQSQSFSHLEYGLNPHTQRAHGPKPFNMLINKAISFIGKLQQERLPTALHVLRRMWIVQEEVSESGQLEVRKVFPRDLSSRGALLENCRARVMMPAQPFLVSVGGVMSKSKLSLICLVILLALPSMSFAQKGSKGAPPVVSSITPTSATAGGPGFALTVSGSNFSTGSIVLWNGSSITTTYVSATQLQGTIPGGLIAAAGTAQVAVYTPGRSGGTSNLVAFTINPATTTTTTTTTTGTPLAITTTSLPVGTAGTAYGQTLAASGGTAPYVWSAISGTVPPGLTLSAAGAVSGMPTTAGSYAFTAQVADSASHTATYPYSMVISTAPLAIATTSVPAGTAGSAYITALGASGGTPPHNWSATSALPPGLAISAAGAISGTPATAGSYAFTAQVADSASHTAAYTYSLTVAPSTVSTTPFFQCSDVSCWGTGATNPNVSLVSNPAPVSYLPSTAVAFHYHICGLPAPPTLSYTPGGALDQTTYYVKITAVDTTGETTPSAEVGLTVPAGNLLVVTLPPPQPDKITGINIYVGTASGGETLQTWPAIPQASVWTMPETGLVAGVAPPTTFTITDCGGASQDTNVWLSTVFTGVNSIYVRAYVYLPSAQPNDSNVSNSQFVQRKLIWLADSTSASSNLGNYQVILTSFSAMNGYYLPNSVQPALVEQQTPSGACPGTMGMQYINSTISQNAWHEIELYLNLSSPGTANGTATVWVDGAQIYTSSTLNLRNTCSTPITFAAFGEQANRYKYNSLDEYRYFNNIAIGTSYIP
jgi:hypothetical protein